MLSGETVVVKDRVTSYGDDREKVETWVEREVVEGAIVAPGDTSDVSGDDRVDGTAVSFTLGFPKTFSGRLRGCRVTVRGRDYAVVGDPQPNSAGNCPTRWWYTARVEAVDG